MIQKAKTIFIKILRYYLAFHWVNFCTDGPKAKVTKTAGATAQTKAVAPNRPSSHPILPTTPTVKINASFTEECPERSKNYFIY